MTTIDKALTILAQSPDHRVLTRVPGHDTCYREPCGRVFRGAVIDLETTGLDASQDTIIEIGVVSFEYDSYGITRIIDVINELEDPGRALTPEITRLTGLTDTDLAGKHFDRARLARALKEARFLIAHNAGFDRPFLEKDFPEAAAKPWACSQTQVPWATDAGMGSAKLEYLVMRHGFFYDAHRAEMDCRATLHLLAQKASWQPGRQIFSTLRDNAIRNGAHVWLVDLPFDYKDAAKSLGCLWSDGTHGARKAWHKEVSTAADARSLLDSINAWYTPARRSSVVLAEVTPTNRFSTRAGASVPFAALQTLADG